MVWPWVVPYSMVDFRVRVARALGAELPYCPVGAVLVVEKFDEGVRRVAVGSLWVG